LGRGTLFPTPLSLERGSVPTRRNPICRNPNPNPNPNPKPNANPSLT